MGAPFILDPSERLALQFCLNLFRTPNPNML